MGGGPGSPGTRLDGGWEERGEVAGAEVAERLLEVEGPRTVSVLSDESRPLIPCSASNDLSLSISASLFCSCCCKACIWFRSSAFSPSSCALNSPTESRTPWYRLNKYLRARPSSSAVSSSSDSILRFNRVIASKCATKSSFGMVFALSFFGKAGRGPGRVEESSRFNKFSCDDAAVGIEALL